MRPPVIHSPQPLNEWVQSIHADVKFVLHHRTDETLVEPIKVESMAALIGPEGGLSHDEIVFAQQQSFKALKLGPRVLRTETAPVVLLSYAQSRWGDM